MPSSVTQLLASTGLRYGGVVKWRTAIPLVTPGVYVVSLDADPHSRTGTLPSAPISLDAVSQLLNTRPELTVDGTRPSADVLCRRVSEFWLPDESVLYVGLAGTSLHDRVQAYYSTKLGRRSPHAGGWFIKLLANLSDLWVHYAPSNDPDNSEDRMLATFVARVSPASRRALRDPAHPFPFANLEWPRGVRKNHGLRGATGNAHASDKRTTPTERAKVAVPRRKIRRSIDVEQINEHIQAELRRRERSEVAAVEAGRWLDEAGLLRDSDSRRGRPLRDLLRAGLIEGQRQEPNGRWFIDRVPPH